VAGYIYTKNKKKTKVGKEKIILLKNTEMYPATLTTEKSKVKNCMKSF